MARAGSIAAAATAFLPLPPLSLLVDFVLLAAFPPLGSTSFPPSDGAGRFMPLSAAAVGDAIASAAEAREGDADDNNDDDEDSAEAEVAALSTFSAVRRSSPPGVFNVAAGVNADAARLLPLDVAGVAAHDVGL